MLVVGRGGCRGKMGMVTIMWVVLLVTQIVVMGYVCVHGTEKLDRHVNAKCSNLEVPSLKGIGNRDYF